MIHRKKMEKRKYFQREMNVDRLKAIVMSLAKRQKYILVGKYI